VPILYTDMSVPSKYVNILYFVLNENLLVFFIALPDGDTEINSFSEV
jgi:hypothetical protein